MRYFREKEGSEPGIENRRRLEEQRDDRDGVDGG